MDGSTTEQQRSDSTPELPVCHHQLLQEVWELLEESLQLTSLSLPLSRPLSLSPSLPLHLSLHLSLSISISLSPSLSLPLSSGAGVDWVTSLSPLSPLLLILQFSDPVSRQKSSDLLLLLISHSPTARENLRDLDGLSTCLRYNTSLIPSFSSFRFVEIS